MSSEPEILRRVVQMHHEGVFLVRPGAPGPVVFRDIFAHEMDKLTYELEDRGYHVWFTCDIDGVEYRLAAPQEGRTCQGLPPTSGRPARSASAHPARDQSPPMEQAHPGAEVFNQVGGM